MTHRVERSSRRRGDRFGDVPEAEAGEVGRLRGGGSWRALDASSWIAAHVCVVTGGESLRTSAERGGESFTRHPRIENGTDDVAMGAPGPGERTAHQPCAARVERDVSDLPREHFAGSDHRRRWRSGCVTPDAELAAELSEQAGEALAIGLWILARDDDVWMVGHDGRGDRLRKRCSQVRPEPRARLLRR